MLYHLTMASATQTTLTWEIATADTVKGEPQLSLIFKAYNFAKMWIFIFLGYMCKGVYQISSGCLQMVDTEVFHVVF